MLWNKLEDSPPILVIPNGVVGVATKLGKVGTPTLTVMAEPLERERVKRIGEHTLEQLRDSIFFNRTTR